MASDSQTLNDAGPTGTVVTLTVDGPVIECYGMENGDQVSIRHAMDGADPASDEVAYVFHANGKKAFPDFKTGERVQANLNPNGANSSRSVVVQVRST